MTRRGLAFALLVAAAFAARSAPAQSVGIDRVELDGARSRAEFGVKVMWLISIHGRFGKVRGTVEIDRFRNQAIVDARIDANAVEMSSDSYESWVKSDEFFDVARHPEIRFVSEAFPLQRLRKGGDLSGILTVRGIEQPTRLELAPAECEKPAYDCAIVVDGAIRRSDFGMHSRRGTLSDKVELHFEVFAVPSPTRLAP